MGIPTPDSSTSKKRPSISSRSPLILHSPDATRRNTRSGLNPESTASRVDDDTSQSNGDDNDDEFLVNNDEDEDLNTTHETERSEGEEGEDQPTGKEPDSSEEDEEAKLSESSNQEKEANRIIDRQQDGIFVCRICGNQDADLGILIDKHNFSMTKVFKENTKNATNDGPATIQRKFRIHADDNGHPVEWPFQKRKDWWDYHDSRTDVTHTPEAKLADFQMKLTAEHVDFILDSFKKAIKPWPPLSAEPLLQHIRRRAEYVIKSLGDGGKRKLKRQDKGISDAAAKHTSELAQDHVKKHLENLTNGIEANFGKWKNEPIELVFRYIQDVFVGNLYRPSIVYQLPKKL